MTDSTRAVLGLGTDPRMPPTVVAMLIVQVVIVVGWAFSLAAPLTLAWADLGGDTVFASHELGLSLQLTALALPAAFAFVVSVGGVLGLFRQTMSGDFAMLVQALAVVMTAAGGLIAIFTGTILVLLLVPLLLVSVALSKVRSSRRWFEGGGFADSPTPWVICALALTTFAIPLWIVCSAWAFLSVLLSLLLWMSGEGIIDAVGILGISLVSLGPVANITVLLAVARRWRMPRGPVLAGSVLAAIGLVILAPTLWWAAVLAVVPSVLLWVPAIAREFATPVPDTTSEVSPRHPG
jgi:hypothetical protein